jgi:hypothetical protein
MKKVSVLLALVLVLVVAFSASAAPSDLPGGGWWSPFQVQNVGEGDGTLTYTAYWQVGKGGAEEDTTYSQDGEITIPQGESLTYNPALAPNYPDGPRIGFATTDKHLPSGFAGGVVVSSDEELRAVVTVNNFQVGDMGVAGGRASAYYQSVQEPAPLLNFPVMKHDYFGQTTTFYIQAAGGDATIDATFSYPDGTKSMTDIEISDGSTYVLDPLAAQVPADVLGSLVVEATAGNIAGVIVETQHNVDVGTFAMSTKAFGPDDADTTIVAPTNKTKFFGGTTGWQLQNTTDVAASATVTFTVANVQTGSAADVAGITPGTQFKHDFSIPANGSYLFSVGAAAGANYYKAVEVGGTKTITDGLFFSGLVVSDQPLVATVNEAAGANRILYSAFGSGNATAKLAAPAVKEAFFEQRTSLNVQNVGIASTTPSASYSCSDGSTYTVGADEGVPELAPGEAFNFFQLSNVDRWGAEVIPASNNCAVTVSADQPIVAVAQESIVGGAQDIKNYEGFNLTP